MSDPHHVTSRFSMEVLIAPLVAILLMGALLGLGGAGLTRVVGQVDHVANFNLEASVRISKIAARIDDVNSRLYRILTERAAEGPNSPANVDLDNLVGALDGITKDLSDYRDTYASDSQKTAINDVLGQLEDFKGSIQWMKSMLEIDFSSVVSFISPFNAYFDRLDTLISTMTADLQSDARLRANMAATDAGKTGQWFLFLTVLAASGAVIASWNTGKTQLRLRINTTELETQVTIRTAELVRTTIDLQTAKTEAENALAEVKLAQRQLIEAEKMAALGSLVAGVAHEINTPVGSALTATTVLEDRVQSFQELYKTGTMKKADLSRFLDTVSEAALLILSNIRRAAELIHSFKQVAVDQASGMCRPFTLRTCLNELLISLRPRLKQTAITIQVDCPKDLTMVGYPGALSQIVTNLVMNSLLHAYGPGAQGAITITAKEVEPGTVELRYADDGAGIPASILPRVFDPFFTTRRSSGGTGLGLHIAYNNVTQKLGGTISIDSTEGQGTIFVLTLPREVPPEREHAPA